MIPAPCTGYINFWFRQTHHLRYGLTVQRVVFFFNPWLDGVSVCSLVGESVAWSHVFLHWDCGLLIPLNCLWCVCCWVDGDLSSTPLSYKPYHGLWFCCFGSRPFWLCFFSLSMYECIGGGCFSLGEKSKWKYLKCIASGLFQYTI